MDKRLREAAQDVQNTGVEMFMRGDEPDSDEAVYGRLWASVTTLHGATGKGQTARLLDLAATAWAAYDQRRVDGDDGDLVVRLAQFAEDAGPVASWDEAVGRLAIAVRKVSFEVQNRTRLVGNRVGGVAAVAVRALADLDL